MKLRNRLLPLLAGLSLPLVSACQVLAPQAQPQPQLFVDRSAGTTSANSPIVPARSQIDTTYTVKRGTIRDDVTVAGKVAPARAAQLNFASAGTVTTVFVRSGQQVKQGESLAELQLSKESLDAAQHQALLAQLTYESQAAKVKELQSGALPSVLADAQAALASAQAAQREAELKAGGAQSTPDQTVALAQLDVDQAQRDVDVARQARDQKTADSTSKLTAASAAVRTAERRAMDASSKFNELVATQAAASAARNNDLQLAQLELQQANADLQVAQQAEQRARHQIPAEMQRAVRLAELDLQETNRAFREAQDTNDRLNLEGPTTSRTRDMINADVVRAEWAVQSGKNSVSSATVKLEQARAALVSTPEQAIASAVAAVSAARTRVNGASVKLDQTRADVGAATDDQAVQQARTAVAQANDDVAQARAAEQQARADSDALQTSQADDAQSAAAQDAAVSAAEGRVQAAQLRLAQARVSQTAAQRDATMQNQVGGMDVAVKRAQTAAALAHVADVQAGTSADAINRESRLADLLRDEADKARVTAQATLTLTAPFDGLVSAVAVSPGQAIDARATVIRFAGNDGLTVIATASETEVSQLTADEQVDVTFPNIPNLTAEGTIVDISGVGSSDGKTTSFPVRVDLAAAPSQLKIGMAALLSLTLRQAPNVLSLPSNTIRQSDGTTVVSRLETDGRVTDVPIQIGSTYGSNVEITGGLNEGDVVAVFRPAGSAVAKQ